MDAMSMAWSGHGIRTGPLRSTQSEFMLLVTSCVAGLTLREQAAAWQSQANLAKRACR